MKERNKVSKAPNSLIGNSGQKDVDNLSDTFVPGRYNGAYANTNMDGMFRICGVFLALSMALNAFFIQKLADATHRIEAYENMRYSVDHEEVEKIGQIFMTAKVSELVMDLDVQKALNFDNKTYDEERYISSGLGLDLLSARVTAKELEANVLSESTHKNIVNRLHAHGAIILPKIHSKSRCKVLAEKAHEMVMDPWFEFGHIHHSHMRKDYPLPLTGMFLDILQDTLSLLRPVFEEILGETVRLSEFSTLISYPGAKSQRFHPDSSIEGVTKLGKYAKMYTGFIYLDDVSDDMAALDLYPGTHSHFHFLPEEQHSLMRSVPFVRLAVSAGTLVLYDSMLLHSSYFTVSTHRYVMPLSFEQSEYVLILIISSLGPTFSLRDQYKRARLQMKNIIEGKYIPQLSDDEYLINVKIKQDDNLCLGTIVKRCSKELEDKDKSQKQLLNLYNCASKLVGEDGSGCLLQCRIEKLLKMSIFNTTFVAKSTWGMY